jgi:hypothetical protein
MKIILNVSERDRILATMQEDQKDFLKNKMLRSKKTAFANELAKSKGIHITDSMTDEEIAMLLEEWELVEYKDAGYVSNELKCECGRPLRYQYVVKHSKTGHIKKFGITHFEEHTGIPPQIVKNIIKGLEQIDYEMDEILLKIDSGWNIHTNHPRLPVDLVLPNDIKQYIELGLPLLEKHDKRLRKLIADYNDDLFLKDSARKIIAKEFELVPNIEVDPTGGYDLFNLQDDHNLKPISRTKERNQVITESGIKINELSLVHNLPWELKEKIYQYLKEGIGSARVICELLIKKDYTQNERYHTEKPKIYLSVCKYLDQLTLEEACEVVSATQIDRVYRLIVNTERGE